MILDDSLTLEEYKELIELLGWKKSSDRLIKLSLENSMTEKYVTNDKTVGMARLITDGGYAGLIMDVIVKPDYQNKGIGTKMIDRLLERVKENLEEGEEVMLQLLAAPGKVEFYKKFGFKVKLSTAEAGMYMWMKK